MARIMVVEDEPITAMDLERMLLAIGHEVAGWSDAGEDAIEKAKELSPDLVLMDIRLQGEMTGIEAADEIRKEAQAHGDTTPVVFLTAFADKDTVDSACRTSPYGYLVKPFTERSVAAAVQVALARADEERELREREHFLSAALRTLGEALVALDSQGRIRFVNAYAIDMFGGYASDPTGRDMHEAFDLLDPDEDREIYPCDLALREGRVTTTRARLRPARGGPERRVVLSVAPMMEHPGSITGAVLAFRDDDSGETVTFTGSRDEQVSERIQHEINSPLTYNLGALSIAIREIDTLRAMRAIDLAMRTTEWKPHDEENKLARIESLIRSAHEGATRIAAVMRELRTSAFIELEHVPIDPIEVLELAVGACADQLGSVSLTRDVHPVPMIRGNKWQLARVLVDQLRAALVDDTDGASIELATRTDESGQAEVRLTIRAGRGKLGDAPEVSSADKVLKGHGAELQIRDVVGARVVSLHAPPLKAKAASREAGRARRGNVLVVDDEPMVGRVLELMLNPYHDVTAVQSAAHALELIEQGNTFDVILCDLSMPGMSGQDFYERLVETRPDVAERMIVTSGGAVNAEAAAFLDTMRDRRLDKPFRAEELIPLLESRIDGASGDESLLE
jgi:PAS domain S-box-containing protein